MFILWCTSDQRDVNTKALVYLIFKITLPVDLRCTKKSIAALTCSSGKTAEMWGDINPSSYSSMTSLPTCLQKNQRINYQSLAWKTVVLMLPIDFIVGITIMTQWHANEWETLRKKQVCWHVGDLTWCKASHDDFAFVCNTGNKKWCPRNITSNKTKKWTSLIIPF